jgi:Family of unknown function (DUF6368)
MGPGASVILPETLSAEQLIELETLLTLISNHVETSTIYYRQFFVADTAPIGGDFIGTRCTFGVAIINSGEPDYELDFETPAIEKYFGFTPRQYLQFDAMCKSNDDHRILGLLILYFAEKYGGIINFFGALIPQSVKIDFGTTQWSEIAIQVDRSWNELPGKIYAIEYEVTSERNWACHVADAEFLHAWLKHPEFHMIK